MNKKLFAILSVLVVGSLLLAACATKTEAPTEEVVEEVTEEVVVEEETEEVTEEVVEEVDEPEEEDCSSDTMLCIGLVTDVGEIDDKSFNQSAWEGVQQSAEALGATINYVETADAKDYMSNIELFTNEDYDVIVTVGYALGEATIEAAQTYPDIDFIGVDQTGDETVPNFTGLLFEEDKSGFLAGVLAGMLTQTDTVAAVLGTDIIPAVVLFKEGYEAGAVWANPDVNVISTYHPGGLDVAFTDPEWGATTAAQAIENGADVIFGAGGKTGNGALIEVAGHEGLYCIGVDDDQWNTVPEAHSCLITSAMKLIKESVVALIGMSVDGTFPGGTYYGSVGLASFHDFEAVVTQDILDKIEEARLGLEDGSIVVEIPTE